MSTRVPSDGSTVRLSLRLKVFGLALSLAALSVILSALIVAQGHRESMRDSAREDARALALTISEYARGALVFEDERGAQTILQNLAANPSISAASLCAPNGNALAKFGKAQGECAKYLDQKGPHLRSLPNTLIVDQEIEHQGEIVGALHLEVSTLGIETRILRDTITLAVVCLALLGASAFLAARLSRVITDPILKLAQIMRRVDAEHLLEERPPPPSEDEIGELYRGFNRMLDQLQEHLDRRKVLEQRLLQAHKLEAVGQLAGGVAHDFNNLLGGLMGYAELLRTTKTAEERDHYTSELIGICERAAQLTSRLLGFARKRKSQSTVFDLNEMVERTATILKRTVDPRIAIATELGRDCMVDGDMALVESAILNLGLNARDAMPEGGRLTFKTTRTKLEAPLRSSIPESDAVGSPMLSIPEGEYVVVEVSDTGSGISAENLSKVFEPFFTTKAHGKGSGLGLNAVADAGRAHHGGVIVDTQTNGTQRGARFRLYLALSQRRLEASARVEAVPKDQPNAAKRVLLVDDDGAIRETVRRILTQAGYAVSTAENGREALACVEQQRFDLILLDMIMPEMHGSEVLKQLRRKCPEIPVLVISGYTDSLSDGAELRPDGFLQKPFTSDQLEQAVSDALLHRSRPHEASQVGGKP